MGRSTSGLWFPPPSNRSSYDYDFGATETSGASAAAVAGMPIERAMLERAVSRVLRIVLSMGNTPLAHHHLRAIVLGDGQQSNVE